MCQAMIRRLSYTTESCQVRKVASLLTEPLSRNHQLVAPKVAGSSRVGQPMICKKYCTSGSLADSHHAYHYLSDVAGYVVWRLSPVCRNIKTLYNFEPPATDEEISAASLQYVRKVTGFNKPSKANEAAFHSAVEEIARITEQLLASLETTAPLKDREQEAAKAKARAALRFGG